MIREQELKEEIEKLKNQPWDYGHVKDCKCGGEPEICEIDNTCVSVECTKCGKEALWTEDEGADTVWNRKN